MESWHCPLCRRRITGRKSVARHLRNVWKSPRDESRCDYLLRTQVPLLEPLVTSPIPVATPIAPAGVEQPPGQQPPRQQPPIPVAIVTTPISPAESLRALARRKPLGHLAQQQVRSAYVISARLPVALTAGCRDFITVQDEWDVYRHNVATLANDKFWQFFLPMHNLSGVAIDMALGNAKRLFLPNDSELFRSFPSSRRQLYTALAKIPAFWPTVMHTVDIDVSDFKLPSRTQTIPFSFIDPIWGWLTAAARQQPLDLHWVPVIGDNVMYGGGVQFGKCFLHAHETVPQGAHVMAISLHWDGTNEHRGLATTPICVGVSNCNNHDPSTQFCLSYMPKVPDDSPSFRKTVMSTEVKFSIRQQCVAAILRVLESAAQTGVLCRLRNQNGVDVQRVLYPRLFAINLDQPEAQLFFGMQNRCCCSKCKRRKGYSAFRTGSPQDRRSVIRLYHIASGADSTNAIIAREKLARWGYNFKRRCCLLSHEFDNVLVKLNEDEVFPCVDYRDRMHGLVIFLHRTITTTLEDLSKQLLSGPDRRILDERLHYVAYRGGFRHPETGHAYRKPKTIFSDVGMTASDKMCELFLLPHVFGPDAEMLPPEARAPLLTVLAYAQLILIAVSGRRKYTKKELEIIFDRGYKMLFGALQRLCFIDHQQHAAWCHKYNKPAPLPHKRKSRCDIVANNDIIIANNDNVSIANNDIIIANNDDNTIVNNDFITNDCRSWTTHRTDNTDTEDTSDDSELGGWENFSHGGVGLSHQHWVQQVVSAGSFGVHCTQAAEAFHKICMKQPAHRVRHLDEKTTTASMLNYLKNKILFDTMIDDTPSPPRGHCDVRPGLKMPLSCGMGTNFRSLTTQSVFLHPELRLTRHEILDMLCHRFRLPTNRRSYALLETLEFAFGQKLVTPGGQTYWAKEGRRDILCLAGYETTMIQTRRVKNDLCCEAVCFLVLRGVCAFLVTDGITTACVNEIFGHIKQDTLTFVIGRWFEPHPLVIERDTMSRPVCPGELHINHCLRRYALTSTDRRSLFARDGRCTVRRNHLQFFGKTAQEQRTCIENERRAYYCLVLSDTIQETVSMCPLFHPRTSQPDLTRWLQTVTLV